jgi:hypothetical protein
VQISRVERTPLGGLRIPAIPTRAGVYKYTEVGPDGASRVVSEYRPPEEVARADSLATLEDVPVTIGHPPGGVTPGNAQRLSVGHVRAASVSATPAGDVSATLIVNAREAVDRVDSKDLCRLSSSYAMVIDPTPGVTPDGQRYDRIQRNIVYNHVALLKPGQERIAGCELRLDSAGEQIFPEASEERPPAMKIKVKRADGAVVEVEKNSDEHVAILEANEAAARTRADAADAAQAQADAARAEQNRAALVTRAKALGVSVTRKDAAGAEVQLSDREIKVAAIKRTDSSFDDAGRSDAYIDGRFDMVKPATAAAPEAPPADPITRALDGAPPAAARADAADPLVRVKEILSKCPGACPL